MKSGFSLKSTENVSWLYGLGGVLIVSFICMTLVFTKVTFDTQRDDTYLEHVTQLRLLTQQITVHAARAANGKEEAFNEVHNRQQAFLRHLTAIRDGEEETGISTPEAAQPQLKVLLATWQETAGLVTQLMQTRDSVTKLYARYDELTQLTNDIVGANEAMVQVLIENGGTPEQVRKATHLLKLLERLGNNIRRSFQGDEGALDAESQINDDIAAFGDISELLLNGSEEVPPELTAVTSPLVQQAIRALGDLFETRTENIDEFLNNSEQLFMAKDASADMNENNAVLLDTIEALQQSYIAAAKGRWISYNLGAVFAGIVLITLIVLLVVVIQSSRERAKQDKIRLDEQLKANQRNQEAILRLLSEIADLADGDLTVTATVTEDFTGAIADALNYSVESMRDLVASIRRTATQVTKAAQTTRGVATDLTKASERQAQQIAKAGQAIIGMANSVKKVSANAVESADVAKKSVEIASKGAKAVQDTIAGMDTIREQIQETSKRIKRLGESSQEIGEIVGLIDDIADQTNILALNASIQAAMAGDAGRGFAVVADEVQRLAERASNATKQIDALVKTIQGDTNEAVSSMEQSTANVVAGSKLAESAGESLIEIESVSVKLAGQIENISQTSRTQAAVASNISGTMSIIQEITMQTSKGTNETAAAIENLAELANELKTSASGFKLPEDIEQSFSDDI